MLITRCEKEGCSISIDNIAESIDSISKQLFSTIETEPVT